MVCSRDHGVSDRIESHLLVGDDVVEAVAFDSVGVGPENKPQQSRVCPDMKAGIDNTQIALAVCALGAQQQRRFNTGQRIDERGPNTTIEFFDMACVNDHDWLFSGASVRSSPYRPS